MVGLRRHCWSLMTDTYLKTLVASVLFMAVPAAGHAQAAPGWLPDIPSIVDLGQTEVMLTGWSWHNPATYSAQSRTTLNDYNLGWGAGSRPQSGGSLKRHCMIGSASMPPMYRPCRHSLMSAATLASFLPDIGSRPRPPTPWTSWFRFRGLTARERRRGYVG